MGGDRIKFLVVGDPHVQVRDIGECERLVDFLEKICRHQEIQYLVFMGDLHHNHELVNSWVTDFWLRSLERLRGVVGSRIIILKGNHDAPHDAPAGVHALVPYREYAQVVDEPTTIRFGNERQVCSVCLEPQEWTECLEPQEWTESGDVCRNRHGGAPAAQVGDWSLLLLPYIHDPAAFVAVCQQNPQVNCVYCHQTANGGQYDNGFYAKDGFDPEAIPQQQVVSGHIHTGQEFGKIWYVGAPRWMTISDANVDKFVWLIEHDAQTGAIVGRESFSTDECCRKVVKLVDSPESPAYPESLKKDWQATVEIVGPPEWIEERRKLWTGLAKIRTRTQKQSQARVRESEGIAVALRKYVLGYPSMYGTPKDVIEGLVAARVMNI